MKLRSFLLLIFLLCASSLIAQQKNRHVVQEGETKESIAKKYNITVAELKDFNPDIESYFYVGLKLNIPQKEQTPIMKEYEIPQIANTNFPNVTLQLDTNKATQFQNVKIPQSDINGIRNDHIIQKNLDNCSQDTSTTTKIEYKTESNRETILAEGMVGTWVSINKWTNPREGTSIGSTQKSLSGGLPYLSITIASSSESPKFYIEGAYAYDYNKKMKGNLGLQQPYFQKLDNNKLYLMWSSSKVKTPNPSFIAAGYSFADTMGDIASSIVNETGSSMITDLGSYTTGVLVSATYSALIDALFPSSKVIKLLECWLEKVNDYELVAKCIYQTIKVFADGTKKHEKVQDKFLLARYDINEKKEDQILKDYRSKSQNLHTLMRLAYENEQKMLSKGIVMYDQYHSKFNGPYLGLTFDSVNQANSYKEKVQHGVYIKDVSDWIVEKRQLYNCNIKRGDILLDIDGFEINSPEQAYDFIKTMTPFTSVNLHILRKGKELFVPLEVTYKIK